MLILGSQSPRRGELLGHFSLPFRQVPSSFDEESIAYEGNPLAYTSTLAEKKGEALLPQFPKDLILTADTVVYYQGKIYNKPRDKEEAFVFLSELSGHWHHVFTAMCLIQGSQKYQGVEETRLLFHKLTEQQIHTYHKHCHFLDKAGGYAIQGVGSLLIERIEGAYDNVMGLPLNLTRTLLLKAGIDLWDYLKPASC